MYLESYVHFGVNRRETFSSQTLGIPPSNSTCIHHVNCLRGKAWADSSRFDVSKQSYAIQLPARIESIPPSLSSRILAAEGNINVLQGLC